MPIKQSELNMEKKMKIALSLQDNNDNSPIDIRFGRAAYFGIFDEANQTWEFISNSQNTQAAQGAGIQAAQHIINADANVLIAANVGPKAVFALQAAGVEIFQSSGNLSAIDAVKAFRDNKLTKLDQANVQGHWI